MIKRVAPGAWPPPMAQSRRLAHRDLINSVRGLDPNTDPGITEAISKYLVVRSAGYVEATRDSVAEEYVRTVSHVRVMRRVKSSLWRGVGVSPAQLEEFIDSFDQDWKLEFSEFLVKDDEARGDSLRALVDARKQIAHGGSTGVRRDTALKWADVSMDVGDWLIKRFNPTAR